GADGGRRGRRGDCARSAVRGADQRRVDESGALACAGGRQRKCCEPLDLPHRADARRVPGDSWLPLPSRKKLLRVTAMKKLKALFLCVHNSARSQMAEAFANEIAGEKIEAESAGLEPGALNPLVVEAMREVGIDI